MARQKFSTTSATPAGTANSIQGVAVKGTVHAEAQTHPTVTWVVA